MHFGLLLIGDELLDGKTSDANTKALGSYLSENGHKLKHVLVASDDEQAIAQSLQVLYESLGCQIVITSGGLGPTPDDKTKAALAKFFNQKIIDRADVAQLVTEQYLAFGREWNPKLNSYHLFPADFKALRNPVGLAPGLFYLHHQGARALACAPGVPREFKEMLVQSIIPEITEHFELENIRSQRLCVCTMGVPEEKLFFELAPTIWNDLSLYGEVASYPRPMGVDIVVRQRHDSPSNWYQKSLALIQASPIHEHIWQVGEEELPAFVMKLLAQKNLTIAFAESCTGGLAASLMTDQAGSSQVFKGSYVTYSNDLKIKALNVRAETLQKFGAVSVEVAREMSAGAREQSGADLAVAFTGIAGPGGATPSKPVGTVALSISSKFGTHAEMFHFRGGREMLKLRFALRGYHLARVECEKF